MRTYDTRHHFWSPIGRGAIKLRTPLFLATVVMLMPLPITHTALAQSASNGPVITGVVDSASYNAGITWGELVSIFGTNLSDGGTYQAQTVPLPTHLGTTQVFASSEVLEVLYVSPTQINVLMSTSNPPQNCQGTGGQCVSLTVQVGTATSPAWNNAYTLYAPALFISGFDCPFLGWPNAGAANVTCGLSAVQKPGQFPRPIVTDANYSLVTNSNPARLGQPYVLWLTGLGNPGYNGDIRSKFATLRMELLRCCLPAYFNGLAGDASVLYAGASSGFPGLYQLNFTLPSLSNSTIGDGTNCGGDLKIEVWASVVADGVSASGGGTGSNSLSIPLYISAAENPCVATITITSSVNPSAQGQMVTFTASVFPSTAIGTVTFLDGAVTLGTAALSGGAATFSTSALAIGSHSITATYNGDSNYGASSATRTQTVSKTPTITTLTSIPNPSGLGQTVIFTATVSPPAATGTVTFSELTCSPAPCSAHAVALGNGTLTGGKATFSASSFSADTHSITVTYGGDANYAGSTSPTIVQTVGKTPTTTIMSSNPNPSISGQPLTLTAVVSPASATGFVAFADSGPSGTSGPISCLGGAVALASGRASCSTSTLFGGPGKHSIAATYSGDGNYAGSSGVLVQTVTQPTSTTLTSSPNPSISGQLVTFTATIAFSAATGTVTFFDGSTVLGTATLSKSFATLATSTLAIGGHSIAATYSGDSNYGASTSDRLAQTVGAH